MKWTFELKTDELPSVELIEDIANEFIRIDAGIVTIRIDDNYVIDLESSSGQWRVARQA